jgi:hypothetical protein
VWIEHERMLGRCFYRWQQIVIYLKKPIVVASQSLRCSGDRLSIVNRSWVSLGSIPAFLMKIRLLMPSVFDKRNLVLLRPIDSHDEFRSHLESFLQLRGQMRAANEIELIGDR